jgi:hypothetical protein
MLTCLVWVHNFNQLILLNYSAQVSSQHLPTVDNVNHLKILIFFYRNNCRYVEREMKKTHLILNFFKLYLNRIFCLFINIVCNQNVQCRTFDYDSYSLVCRLFEGAVNTGNIISSGSLTSYVGSVQLPPNLFAAFGQQCVQCLNSRYLVCSSNSNNTCQCPENTIWNGVICQNQGYEDTYCSNNQWCREDVGMNCSNLHFCTGNMEYTSYHLIRVDISTKLNSE